MDVTLAVGSLELLIVWYFTCLPAEAETCREFVEQGFRSVSLKFIILFAMHYISFCL